MTTKTTTALNCPECQRLINLRAQNAAERARIDAEHPDRGKWTPRMYTHNRTLLRQWAAATDRFLSHSMSHAQEDGQ